MQCRFLGGGEMGLQGAMMDYLAPDSGHRQYSTALNNIGLLVGTWGRVTQTGADYLYINDGANLKDGTLTGEEENVGVRVICDPAGNNAGDMLIATGVSSCFQTPSGKLARRILTRRAGDIVRVYP
jgi:hypothetical protein